MGPWNLQSFPDGGAQWIWSYQSADSMAYSDGTPNQFQYIYNNRTFYPIYATVYYSCDYYD